MTVQASRTSGSGCGVDRADVLKAMNQAVLALEVLRPTLGQMVAASALTCGGRYWD